MIEELTRLQMLVLAILVAFTPLAWYSYYTRNFEGYVVFTTAIVVLTIYAAFQSLRQRYIEHRKP